MQMTRRHVLQKPGLSNDMMARVMHRNHAGIFSKRAALQAVSSGDWRVVALVFLRSQVSDCTIRKQLLPIIKEIAATFPTNRSLFTAVYIMNAWIRLICLIISITYHSVVSQFLIHLIQWSCFLLKRLLGRILAMTFGKLASYFQHHQLHVRWQVFVKTEEWIRLTSPLVFREQTGWFHHWKREHSYERCYCETWAELRDWSLLPSWAAAPSAVVPSWPDLLPGLCSCHRLQFWTGWLELCPPDRTSKHNTCS